MHMERARDLPKYTKHMSAHSLGLSEVEAGLQCQNHARGTPLSFYVSLTHGGS